MEYTRNAFDLDNIFTTAIFFPMEWDHSNMDGFSARLSLRQYKGLTAYTTLGHARARVFGPENGGLIFGSPVDVSVVRIDHDQALQSTTHVQYELKKNGPWVGFTWRYDSGIVSGAVPDLASVLGLTAGQQAQIGFLLRQSGGDTFELDHNLQFFELGNNTCEHPCTRHGKRRQESRTCPPSQSIQHRRRDRQSVPHRSRALDLAV